MARYPLQGLTEGRIGGIAIAGSRQHAPFAYQVLPAASRHRGARAVKGQLLFDQRHRLGVFSLRQAQPLQPVRRHHRIRRCVRRLQRRHRERAVNVVLGLVMRVVRHEHGGRQPVRGRQLRALGQRQGRWRATSCVDAVSQRPGRYSIDQIRQPVSSSSWARSRMAAAVLVSAYWAI